MGGGLCEGGAFPLPTLEKAIPFLFQRLPQEAMDLSVVRRISSLRSNSACVPLRTYNQGHLKRSVWDTTLIPNRMTAERHHV